MTLKNLYRIILEILFLFFLLVSVLSCKRIKNSAEVESVGVYEIKGTSARAEGEITSLGDGVLDYGFCWKQGAIPTVDHAKVSLGTTGNTGLFSGTVHDLEPVTTYFLKAYLTDNYGTTYGDLLLFNTIYDFETDTLFDIEGNKYHAVKVDTLWWMAENLKVTKLNDGTDIPLVTGTSDWCTTEMPSYCWSGNDYSNNEEYGLLYNWYAVNTGRLCPAGWHVSAYSEWEAMDSFLGTESGDRLKETGTEHWPASNEGATNAVGFTALPGGYRDGSDGRFYGPGYDGYWWSSAESSATGAKGVCISYQYSYLSANNDAFKKNGYSVRCVKDY